MMEWSVAFLDRLFEVLRHKGIVFFLGLQFRSMRSMRSCSAPQRRRSPFSLFCQSTLFLSPSLVNDAGKMVCFSRE